MNVSLIAAASRNNIIGSKNKLPWKLSADLKHFKSLTLNNAVIMGRKTYESIGHLLPQRTNIVITRQQGFNAPCCAVVHSMKQALAICTDEEEVFVIGGAQIYEAALPYANRIYLTRIHKDFSGDTELFEISEKTWTEIQREEHEADDKNPHAYSFVVLERTEIRRHISEGDISPEARLNDLQGRFSERSYTKS
ncbi:MAG: dihydrofolate reductase [Candidatus Omnitrophica bacterium]|nr:dihydrofolate reductase [Candidatus Omnitrophota bacterium]